MRTGKSSMKFVQEKSASYRIHAYADGEVTLIVPPAPGEQGVNETNLSPKLHTYTSSLVVTAQSLVTDWHPTSVEHLTSDHFTEILSLEPEILLLGTGARQHFPAAQVLQSFYQQNIGVEVMDTAAACRTFNILVAEGRHIAAALLIN